MNVSIQHIGANTHIITVCCCCAEALHTVLGFHVHLLFYCHSAFFFYLTGIVLISITKAVNKSVQIVSG